jgi:uncharacterized protein (DUF58 family)
VWHRRVVYHSCVTRSLLTPSLLVSLGDLDVVARTIVDGLRTGPHRSPFHGYSAEFSQYRHYRPGDDLKHVDWKLLARTDRLYTRQFRETTDLTAQLVIDASASMGFADRTGTKGARPPTKLAVASMAAAALAYLLSKQGDAVGVQVFPGGQPFLSPRAGSLHLRAVLSALARVEAQGAVRPDEAVRRAAAALPRRGLLLVWSDFYDREHETLTELARARAMGHDVAVFHVVTRTELEFPFQGDTEFRDAESEDTLDTNGAAVRAEYRDAFAAFLERWRGRLRGEGIDYALLMTDAPLDEALRRFLLRRHAGVP